METLGDGEPRQQRLAVVGPTRRELASRARLRGGYAYDPARTALLLERLGPPLAELGLPVETQLAMICATLAEAWTAPPGGVAWMTGAAKIVLQQRFELIQGFGDPSFRRHRCFVLVPQRNDILLDHLRQRRQEGKQVGALLARFGGAGLLVDGRNVATDRLAQVVDDADLEQPPNVNTVKVALQSQREQAEPPGMRGGALRLPAGGLGGAMHILQALRLAEKVQDAERLVHLHSYFLNATREGTILP